MPDACYGAQKNETRKEMRLEVVMRLEVLIPTYIVLPTSNNSLTQHGTEQWRRHRVQLVGELLLELLVRGSNPSGVGLLLGSIVRGWSPIGWRVASRTLGQGFKPLRCRIAPGIRSQGLELHWMESCF